MATCPGRVTGKLLLRIAITITIRKVLGPWPLVGQWMPVKTWCELRVGGRGLHCTRKLGTFVKESKFLFVHFWLLAEPALHVESRTQTAILFLRGLPALIRAQHDADMKNYYRDTRRVKRLLGIHILSTHPTGQRHPDQHALAAHYSSQARALCLDTQTSLCIVRHSPPWPPDLNLESWLHLSQTLQVSCEVVPVGHHMDMLSQNGRPFDCLRLLCQTRLCQTRLRPVLCCRHPTLPTSLPSFPIPREYPSRLDSHPACPPNPAPPTPRP